MKSKIQETDSLEEASSLLEKGFNSAACEFVFEPETPDAKSELIFKIQRSLEREGFTNISVESEEGTFSGVVRGTRNGKTVAGTFSMERMH